MKILSVKAISGRAAFPPSHFERFGSSSSRPVQRTVLAAVWTFHFLLCFLPILFIHSFIFWRKKSLGHCMTFFFNTYYILFCFLALRVEQLRKVYWPPLYNFPLMSRKLHNHWLAACPALSISSIPMFLSHFLLFLFSDCWVVCLTFGDDTIQILEESN